MEAKGNGVVEGDQEEKKGNEELRYHAGGYYSMFDPVLSDIAVKSSLLRGRKESRETFLIQNGLWRECGCVTYLLIATPHQMLGRFKLSNLVSFLLRNHLIVTTRKICIAWYT